MGKSTHQRTVKWDEIQFDSLKEKLALEITTIGTPDFISDYNFVFRDSTKFTTMAVKTTLSGAISRSSADTYQIKFEYDIQSKAIMIIPLICLFPISLLFLLLPSHKKAKLKDELDSVIDRLQAHGDKLVKQPRSSFAGNQESPLEAIERLSALKEKGAISFEEFEENKAKLLQKI